MQSLAASGRFASKDLARFAQFIEQSPDEALYRMSPYGYAQREGITAREATDLFLHATHAGVLEFSWGVVCPACGWFLTTPSALRSLSHRFCQLCEVPIETRLDDNVEIAFTVSPQVRRITYHSPPGGKFDLKTARQIYSPSLVPPEGMHEVITRALRWDGEIPPGGQVELPMDVAGHFALMVPAHHAVTRIHVDPACTEQTVQTDLVNGHFVPRALRVSPGGRLIVTNRQLSGVANAGLYSDILRDRFEDASHVFAAETKLRRFLTGKELVTAQAFQELFRAESLPSDGGLELKSVTLVFTDLKGSTELYQRVGDLRAYGLVREHFGVLREAVAARGGGIVKTIGDAIMASFPEPLAALESAAAMHQRIAQMNGDLSLKIGLHSGPCIAVELNERLDYFGQTVNIAARVQGVAGANETVTTDAVLGTPGAQGAIDGSGWAATSEQVALKGIDGLYPVHRLRRAGAA